MMKQTAVEWMIEQLDNPTRETSWPKVKEDALKMEQRQMMEAYVKGLRCITYDDYNDMNHKTKTK